MGLSLVILRVASMNLNRKLTLLLSKHTQFINDLVAYSVLPVAYRLIHRGRVFILCLPSGSKAGLQCELNPCDFSKTL